MIIGGAQENTLLNCLDLIQEHGDEVLLITGPAVGPEGDLLSQFDWAQGRAGELPVQVLPELQRSIHPWRDWKAYRAIQSAIVDFRPDVVHTHSAKGGMLGRGAGWSQKIPAVVHTVHGAPFHPYQSPLARGFFERCERWAGKHCHHLISVADAMTDLMVDANIAPREKFTTIYSGMEVEPFVNASDHRQQVRARFGFGKNDIVIGKIARFFHLKGHDELITAAVDVIKGNPNVRFLLVGDGMLRGQHEQRIASLGLSQHFVFTGLVPPTEVPELIGAMDVVVHASLREGLARVLPQALIAGRPVVSYDIDGAREVAITGQTGFLVPPQDIAQLAQSISTLAADPELRSAMGREGQRRFTDQFDHLRMTREIRKVYRAVLDRSM
jgi:glycosyltransferase involved in cell wall biosynthesis